MRLKEVISAQKTDIKISAEWKAGKVPKHDFPIARQAYRLGNSFIWRTISFAALGRNFRVLVIMNETKLKYEAMLGLMDAGMLRLLCSYEYHPNEPGWHCHATCEDSATVPRGIMRGPWVRRIPRAGKYHRRHAYPEDRNVAIHRALDRYNIEQKGLLL